MLVAQRATSRSSSPHQRPRRPRASPRTRMMPCRDVACASRCCRDFASLKSRAARQRKDALQQQRTSATGRCGKTRAATARFLLLMSGAIYANRHPLCWSPADTLLTTAEPNARSVPLKQPRGGDEGTMTAAGQQKMMLKSLCCVDDFCSCVCYAPSCA